MFKTLIFAVCVCTVLGLPLEHKVVGNDQPYEHHPIPFVPIISEEFDNRGDGSFRFGYVSGDGTKVEEEGALRVYDEKTAEEVVRGKYEYVSPEGKSIKVEYLADGSGYHVFSDDIAQSAGVAPLAQYANYAQDRQGAYNPLVASRAFHVPEEKHVVPAARQYQGIYNPLVAARSFPVPEEKAVVPVTPFRNYVQDGRQYQGVYNPVVAARSFPVFSERNGVPASAFANYVHEKEHYPGVYNPFIQGRTFPVPEEKPVLPVDHPVQPVQPVQPTQVQPESPVIAQQV